MSVGPLAAVAYADGTNRRATPPARSVASDFSVHQSILKISDRERFPQQRAIRLARNKTMLIELPVEMRDVLVSNPEIMDAMVQSSDRLYLIGKKIGQSNAFIFDINGNMLLTLEVTIENDVLPLEALLRRLLPGSDIKIEMLNDTVVLTGSVRSPADSNRAADIASRFQNPKPEDEKRSMSKVINMLTVEGEEQVMLKVVVAEVQREALKQFGVNLGAVINSGSFTTTLLSENLLPLTAAAGLGTLPLAAISTDTATTAACAAGQMCLYNGSPGAAKAFGNSGAASAGRIGGEVGVAGVLRALERHGLVKTLAEPNLTAISGEAAKFLAGGEYPIPVAAQDGQISVSFKEFGVGVAFTPVVLDEGRISLKIETEVSELTNNGAVTLSGITIPALRKRTARSTVELPSGGSLAMAGLLSEDTRQNIDGFPGLKDVPILGTLFRSRDFIKRESELVVIVTPYLVRPTARRNLATPGDGLAAATDFRANFLGHLNRIYRREVALPAGSLKDYGFIVD